LWIGVALVALVVAGGGAFMAVKKRRRAPSKCHTCGADVPGAGDLCPTCRHAAAVALRQAAAERADHQRALGENQQRQSQHKEELRLRRARDEDDARLREQEDARQREEHARRRQEQEDESRERSRRAVVDAEAVVDPYLVLGVPGDAGKEAIDAAWQEARSKYAPDQVAHLGPELQAHYKRKAEAVERAYRILTE
jgi:DnaJ-domain-containing protein 1